MLRFAKFNVKKFKDGPFCKKMKFNYTTTFEKAINLTDL